MWLVQKQTGIIDIDVMALVASLIIVVDTFPFAMVAMAYVLTMVAGAAVATMDGVWWLW